MSHRFTLIRRRPKTTVAGQTPNRLLLTVDEAAQVLRIGRTKLYELVQEGRISPVHLGRSTRFTMREVERFVAQLDADHPAA